MDAYRKVQPGEPLKIAAAAWNRVIDEVTVRPRFGGAQNASSRTNFVARCRNQSGEDVPRWGVLAITGVLTTPGSAGQNGTVVFEDSPVLAGATPTGTTVARFAIAVEPIKAGSFGLVAVDGVVQAKLDVVSESHRFATVKPGSTAELLTAGNGEASILWKQPGLGSGKWGLVRIGSAASSVRVGKYRPTGTTGPWAAHTINEVQVYESGTPPAETATSGDVLTGVVNHSRDVPWDSWVLVDRSQSGHWYLVEIEGENGLVRLGKYEPTGTTGPWAIDTINEVVLYEDGTPPNETASGETLTGVVNHSRSVEHGSWVLCERSPAGHWYLVEAEGDEGVVRLGKYEPTGTTGAWQVDTINEVVLYEGGTPPNETAAGGVLTGVVNHSQKVEHGSWVLCEKGTNGRWYLVEAERNPVTGPCKMEIAGESLVDIEGYDSMSIQMLGHSAMASGPSGPTGCAGLRWYSITTCTGTTGV